MGTVYIFDEPTFYILAGGLVGFLFLAAWHLVLFVFSSIRHAIGPFVKAWMKKKVVDIESSDAGTVEFVLRDMTSEGLVCERKLQGIKYVDAKIVPRESNPISSKRFFVKNTGIPVFMSWAGKAVAVTPEMLAAIAITEMSKKKELDPQVKKWAEERKIPVEVLKKLNKTTKPAKVERKTVKKSLLALDPRQLRDYVKGKVLDTGQFRILMKKERLRGREEGSRGPTKFLIPIVLAVVVFVLILFVVPQFLGEGGLIL